MTDYSAWRKVWNGRPWHDKESTRAPAFEVSILLASGEEHSGACPGPLSKDALASAWGIIRSMRINAGRGPCAIVDYAVVPLRESVRLPMLYVKTVTDPDRARVRCNTIAAAETARHSAVKKSRAFSNAVQARLDAQSSPLRWTEKEMVLAESRASALAEMLAAEKAAIRRIRVRMEKEKERQAAER